ncbi:F-box domain containing protein [Trema orientale]|uniref:F-box domain containing protein n=1 Tax=Trema orientale TaxID=63057 RepID=A0A2P5CCZ4_TREOI|nr:F-box domain containing protein [Trema orientale]
MELIPGLPDDIARECLIRANHRDFPTLASTCRAWRAEIRVPEFFRRRKAVGLSRSLIVMAQARVQPGGDSGSTKYLVTPTYRLTVLEPESGRWSELSPGFGLSDGLPLFCQLVRVGSDLVVMGGWDPRTWTASTAVYVYNFVLAKWRRGTDMPGVPRSFFGCAASDSDRAVFLAGGHDDQKNALRSAMAYDVAKDEWRTVPDMARERDECKGVFHRGKFHVIGGYRTEMQGQFESSAEVFDASTWQWDQVHEDFLDATSCPRTCVSGEDGLLYMCRAGEVAALANDTWKVIGTLPNEVHEIAYVLTWQGKLLVIGSPRFGEPHTAYVLDTKQYTWTKMTASDEYSSHVQSGCCLEL